MPKAPFAWTKPGLELEIGIGDFEHLAAPFRLRGKVRELCEHDGPATFDEFSDLIEEVRFARDSLRWKEMDSNDHSLARERRLYCGR